MGKSSLYRRTHLPAVLRFVPAAFLCLGVLLATSSATAQTFTSLYSFPGAPNGASPSSRLLRDGAGNLYGTTYNYGQYYQGIAFKIDATGNESILHSFGSAFGDGAVPNAGLILDSSGNLWGTTSDGGTNYKGTVYKIDSTGNESVVYSFGQSATDGAYPYSSLTMDSSGNFYGTTEQGGAYGKGTIFKLTPSGAESVVYSFGATSADGAYPLADLTIDSGGNLYGTTYEGGFSNWGTVFEVDTTGSEVMLYSFGGPTGTNYYDGANPRGGVVRDSAGNLYGATYGGGQLFGAVYKLNSSGQEVALYSMTQADGLEPYGTLVQDAAGNLYGTAAYGGVSVNNSATDGTVFRIDSNLTTLTVLHTFSGLDGSAPEAGLYQDASGNFYGSTISGGVTSSSTMSSYGTVFALIMTVPFSYMDARVNINSGPPPAFNLKSDFTLGSGAAALNPYTQSLTVSIGSFAMTFPAGSFRTLGSGTYAYSGTVSGASVNVKLNPQGSNSYTVQISGSGVDLSTLANPVTVSITMGNNTGSTQVTANIQ